MRAPPARATLSLVVVTCVAYLLGGATTAGPALPIYGGFIPARFSGMASVDGMVPAILTPLTATLIHGGILHIGFNMLMLGFCGKLVEAALGRWGLFILYVAGAYASALGQYLAGPQEMAPMIGASGAVSAVLGAQVLLYGRQTTRARGPFSARTLHMLWLAAAWIGLQILVGLAWGGGIAIAAHIGGFLAGLALARPLLMARYRSA